MKANYQRYLLFVASGTPEEELHYILKERGLDIYFRGTYGTPRTKAAIISQILTEYQLVNKEAILIGDAESDKIAAKEAGVIFIAKIKGSDDALGGCRWKIRDFIGLEEVIDRISKRSRG